MEAPPQFQILRPLQVRAADGGVVAITGARERALLTRLLVDVGHPVTDTRLLDDLWPDLGDSARKSLQVRVSTLRRQLADLATISRIANGYQLEVDPRQVDASRFEHALDLATRRPPSEAAELLEHALQWWTPSALAELEGTPAEVLREHYERLARDGRQRLGDALVAAGRPARGARVLAGLADGHPQDESVATSLVHALYADGRSVDALAAHRRTVEALAADGLDPSPAFRALVTGVVRHDLPVADRSPSSDPPAATPARGEHAAADAWSSLLHPVPTPFLGRRAAVTAAVEALVEDRVRLLTLWGPGGVGKTRLALEVVDRVAALFPEPAIVVDGARIDDPADLPAAMVRAADLPERGSPMEVLAAGLSDRRVLVVVDNVEHLLAATPVFTRLLAAGDGVQVLVTSRAVLNLRTERVQAVEPLGSTTSEGEVSAVDFLRGRAREMGATDLDDDAALGRIATRLDGLPLALELAAARLRGTTPSRLETDLTARMDALGVLHDLPERQQTLRATVAWSVARLDRPTRDLLLALGVFAAPARLEAITAISPPAQLDRLIVLVDHALLRRVPTPDGVGAFGLLETVRRWAADELASSGRGDPVRRRHADHHAAEVAVASAALETSSQASATRRLAELEADVERSLRTFRDLEDHRALRTLVLDLWRWWWGVAATRTAARWLQVAAGGPDSVDRVRVLSHLALVRATLGDPLGARGALRAAESVDLPADPPELDVARWIVALDDGALDEAASAADRAARAYDALGRDVLAAEMRVRGAVVAATAGDPSSSEQANRDALAVLARHGPRWEEASVRNNLAHLALMRGDTDTALAEARASLATFDRLPFARDRWVALETLLTIHVARGELDRAREVGQVAIREARRVGDRESVQRVRIGLAEAAMRADDPAEAAELLLQTPPEKVPVALQWHLLAVCVEVLAAAEDDAGASDAATLASRHDPSLLVFGGDRLAAGVARWATRAGSGVDGVEPDLTALATRLRVVATRRRPST
ncbi:AfsR/SARP family transcriptional regulator [Salsipaludibacter albus]|uniref:AfsR/SARP family transcriptional regulator n=1 Tax=Salsipaludibacter albus TaxID=2849650 RepID=UPI001EE44046|nr:winged helix-turn-helix domain-containing protein [Salsipaludibacter albus]